MSFPAASAALIALIIGATFMKLGRAPAINVIFIFVFLFLHAFSVQNYIKIPTYASICEKIFHKNAKNLHKYLHISKKSSNFAADLNKVQYILSNKIVHKTKYSYCYMRDIYQYSTPEIIQILGQRERTYRIRLGLTQKELAERAGISVPTLQAFENGINKDISFSTLLRILRGIGQLEGADTLLAEIPESPYTMRESGEQRQRVRHKKR
jgi:DNA-binding XRE family transcriptional regulator